jgi:hypothetical protein
MQSIKLSGKQTAITLLDLPNFFNFYLTEVAILAFPSEAQVI